MRIVLMGPPGAGKGTQAKALVAQFALAHLSSGDIFRAEKASGSPLGRKVGQYMDAGELVPDEIVVDVMAEAITQSGAEGGLLLDGFPRTVAQARALDRQLDEAGVPLDVVVVISADDSLIVERITGRRTCPKCGRIYHVKFIPPAAEGICDDCETELIQRDDDTEQVVRQRLEAYKVQTAPVVEYYRTCGDLKVVEADGSAPAEEVHAAVAEVLEKIGPVR